MESLKKTKATFSNRFLRLKIVRARLITLLAMALDSAFVMTLHKVSVENSNSILCAARVQILLLLLRHRVAFKTLTIVAAPQI